MIELLSFLHRLDTICGLVGLRFRVRYLPPTMGNISEITLADLDAFEAVFQNEGITKISHIADVTAEDSERIGIFYNFHVYQSVK